jgi:hypothetical protein
MSENLDFVRSMDLRELDDERVLALVRLSGRGKASGSHATSRPRGAELA